MQFLQPIRNDTKTSRDRDLAYSVTADFWFSMQKIKHIFSNTRSETNIANDQWPTTLYFLPWTVENGLLEYTEKQSEF